MAQSQSMKLVILGRDGVLNEFHTDHIKGPDEWVPLPGALEAVARLNHAGWHVVVATNQSGLGRGLLDMASVNAIHVKMNEMLVEQGGRVDAVFFCPHEPEVQCDCRKPLPGLMLKIAERFGVTLADVPMVGDTLRDLLAARAAGCQPHLVRSGRAGGYTDAEMAELRKQVPGTEVHDSLDAFATALITREAHARGQAHAHAAKAG
jgi:D-glycero-D-manno-heptose 1,7-bisphosphate phosphatase